LKEHVAPCCSFRKYVASSRRAACPGTAEEICITNIPGTLPLSFWLLTAPRNLAGNTLSLPCLIRSLCKMFTADSKCHPRKAKQSQAKRACRTGRLTDSSFYSPPSLSGGINSEVCHKCSAHLCHYIITMIIINNNNNLDVKMLQQLGLMDAESNTSLPGSCQHYSVF